MRSCTTKRGRRAGYASEALKGELDTLTPCLMGISAVRVSQLYVLLTRRLVNHHPPIRWPHGGCHPTVTEVSDEGRIGE